MTSIELFISNNKLCVLTQKCTDILHNPNFKLGSVQFCEHLLNLTLAHIIIIISPSLQHISMGTGCLMVLKVITCPTCGSCYDIAPDVKAVTQISLR